jgi:hypothetical protein
MVATARCRTGWRAPFLLLLLLLLPPQPLWGTAVTPSPPPGAPHGRPNTRGGAHPDDVPPSPVVVPRTIFTFWSERRQYPELVAACIASLRRRNPGWRIVVLHPDVRRTVAPPPSSERADCSTAPHS